MKPIGELLYQLKPQAKISMLKIQPRNFLVKRKSMESNLQMQFNPY